MSCVSKSCSFTFLSSFWLIDCCQWTSTAWISQYRATKLASPETPANFGELQRLLSVHWGVWVAPRYLCAFQVPWGASDEQPKAIELTLTYESAAPSSTFDFIWRGKSTLHFFFFRLNWNLRVTMRIWFHLPESKSKGFLCLTPAFNHFRV